MKGNSPFGDFVWFQGVVESLDDPKMANRVRVRAVGYHTEDLNELPSTLLPWAPVMGWTGEGAPKINPGDWVAGWFLDGDHAQKPVVMGVIPGIPSVKADPTVGFNDPSGVHPRRVGKPTNSHAARGETDASDYRAKTAWQNPVAFKAKYPFNKVYETDKGALFEMDDTEGAERVNVFHHKGSYVEFLPDGTVVVKSVKDRWDVSFGNHTMLVNGDLMIGATGNVKIVAGKDLKLSAGGTLDVASGADLNLGAGGNSTHMAGGNIKMNGAKFDWGIGGDATGGPDSLDGPGDTSTYEPKQD